MSAMRMYTKREIADAQLARALALFIDNDDYLCAITLAGAADEIYGNLYRAIVAQDAAANLNRQEDKPDPRAAIDYEVEALQAIGAHFGDEIDQKSAIGALNNARNAMKHYTASGDPVKLDAADEAAEIIDRAVRNVMLLDGNYPTRIGEFDEKRRRLDEARQREIQGK